jgi:hypothetical protein
MSLHPGEIGVCPKHGEYDEYCNKCADEKLQTKNRVTEVYIGAYHDYVFVNGNEIIRNPTAADYKRVADEGGIDLRVLSE